MDSYSITNEHGFIPQDERFENGGTMREADKKMYYIVSPHSFAYNPARINIGSIGYQNTDKNVIVSSLYEVFKTSDDVDDRLLWYWFKSSYFQKLIEQFQEGGVRLYFYYDKLCMGTLSLPSFEEQHKIGKYLDTYDNLITLHQRKLDKMKELKKAFLNLIFSQKLRFYGFTDSWELRKLEEVAPLRGGYAFQSNQYANEGIPIVRISNILSDGSVGGEFVFHNELKDDEIFMLENGDIVLAMSGATTGKVSILSSEKSCKYYQNQRVGLFSKTATCNYSFVATIVRSEKFLEQLRDVLVAGAQPNVSAKDIDAFDFSVPKDVEEQSQIGNFFRTLDRLITLYQKKIDSSKEMKKILLKNMLI